MSKLLSFILSLWGSCRFLASFSFGGFSSQLISGYLEIISIFCFLLFLVFAVLISNGRIGRGFNLVVKNFGKVCLSFFKFIFSVHFFYGVCSLLPIIMLIVICRGGFAYSFDLSNICVGYQEVRGTSSQWEFLFERDKDKRESNSNLNLLLTYYKELLTYYKDLDSLTHGHLLEVIGILLQICSKFILRCSLVGRIISLILFIFKIGDIIDLFNCVWTFLGGNPVDIWKVINFFREKFLETDFEGIFGLYSEKITSYLSSVFKGMLRNFNFSLYSSVSKFKISSEADFNCSLDIMLFEGSGGRERALMFIKNVVVKGLKGDFGIWFFQGLDINILGGPLVISDGPLDLIRYLLESVIFLCIYWDLSLIPTEFLVGSGKGILYSILSPACLNSFYRGNEYLLLSVSFFMWNFIHTSLDVIHSLGSLPLFIKSDSFPGQVSITQVKGLYKRGLVTEIFCSELCGESHSYMKVKVLFLLDIEVFIISSFLDSGFGLLDADEAIERAIELIDKFFNSLKEMGRVVVKIVKSLLSYLSNFNKSYLSQYKKIIYLVLFIVVFSSFIYFFCWDLIKGITWEGTLRKFEWDLKALEWQFYVEENRFQKLYYKGGWSYCIWFVGVFFYRIFRWFVFVASSFVAYCFIHCLWRPRFNFGVDFIIFMSACSIYFFFLCYYPLPIRFVTFLFKEALKNLILYKLDAMNPGVYPYSFCVFYFVRICWKFTWMMLTDFWVIFPVMFMGFWYGKEQVKYNYFNPVNKDVERISNFIYNYSGCLLILYFTALFLIPREYLIFIVLAGIIMFGVSGFLLWFWVVSVPFLIRFVLEDPYNLCPANVATFFKDFALQLKDYKENRDYFKPFNVIDWRDPDMENIEENDGEAQVDRDFNNFARERDMPIRAKINRSESFD